MNELLKNNKVMVCGEICSDFTFSHEVLGEGFYKFFVKVQRLSGVYDMVPALVSERIMDIGKNMSGQRVVIEGQFRSWNEYESGRSRLILFLFAVRIGFGCHEDENYILLEGYVCKEPIYRNTPLGREIANILLAVNRPYGKSDYIPCICWGRNARFAGGFKVGEHIQIHGRIQSREYQKKISEDECETRTAYEISVHTISLISDDLGGDEDDNSED